MRPTRDDENATDVDRRFVLQALGGSIALGSLATEVEGETDDDEEYVVVQDDECVPVVPLSGDRTVEELYDLRIPERYEGDDGATDPGSGPYYQSNGTTDLQRVNTTITFLYDGPDGLSLVVVHDSPDGRSGGAVSWTLDAVPSDAAWVVKDDLYVDPDTGTEQNFDQWTVDGSEHVVDWTWGNSGTDGGALRPLGDEFSIDLDPAFNEQAALWGEHYAEDPITDWQILSFPDGRSEPERTSLALDERVTIRAGACDDDGSAGKIADPDDGKDREKDDNDRKDRDEKDDEDEKDNDGKKDEDRGEDTDEEEEGTGRDEKEGDKDGKDEKEDEDEDKEKDEKEDEEKNEDRGEDSDEDEEEGTGRDEKEGDKGTDEEKDEDDEDDDEDEDDDKDDEEKGRGRGNGGGNGRGNDDGGGNGNGHGNDR